MGWWNAGDNENIVIGDDVLDAVRHFLKDFSQAYQEEFSRKPTVEELQYVLNLGFNINANDDILADFSEKEVRQVTIRTKKIPKRQKAKPGDIFCFKISPDHYAFGRVVSIIFIGAVVEIFKETSKLPLIDSINTTKEDFIGPIIIDNYSLFERHAAGDWRIIKSNEGYTPDQRLEKVLFVYGDTPDNFKCVDIFDNRRPISPEAAQGLPRCVPYGNRDVINLVLRTLKLHNQPG